MKIYICQNYEEMSARAADLIAEQIKEKPDSVLGLATGSSPIGLYKELVMRNQKGDISFKDIKTVNLDEYCGLTADNDQSYAYFMNHNLFDHVDIDKANTTLPDGTNPDAAAECARYDALIASLGGIDLPTPFRSAPTTLLSPRAPLKPTHASLLRSTTYRAMLTRWAAARF